MTARRDAAPLYGPRIGTRSTTPGVPLVFSERLETGLVRGRERVFWKATGHTCQQLELSKSPSRILETYRSSSLSRVRNDTQIPTRSKGSRCIGASPPIFISQQKHQKGESAGVRARAARAREEALRGSAREQQRRAIVCVAELRDQSGRVRGVEARLPSVSSTRHYGTFPKTSRRTKRRST